MDLAIGLPLRHRQDLAQLLQRLYDPGSPDYHHYLTTQQFTQRFGPSEQDYRTLVDFVTRQGFKVTGTHPNRLLLDASATTADVERAFNVKMKLYQHPTEPRTFFAPDIEPSVDTALPVLEIGGLNNYVTPHPTSLIVGPLNLPPQLQPSSGSGPAGTYIGNDFRAAYFPNVSLDGTGQTVGLFELDGYYGNDITNYESQAGLPNVPLTNVLIDGFSGNPDGNANFISEVSLDIEMAIAMAPGLSSVIVYEAPNTNLTIGVINDLLNRMASDNLAKQISCSWAWGGGTNATGDQIFLQYAAQGQSFLAASGDSGAYDRFNPIAEPSDDPYITIVGGTTLTTSGPGGSWVSEKALSWFPSQANATSGGISRLYPIPSWQQPVSMSVNKGSTKMRNIPDIALTADNVFVIYNNGSQGSFGGTSCATPLWAAFIALANQHGAIHGHPTLGFINPALYTIGQGGNYTTDFHDITVGNNTNNTSPNLFFAVAGYDLCTGWGTPNSTNMLNALFPGLSPLTPTVTWNTPAAFVYGLALGAGQLNATANVPGSFRYSPAAGTVLRAGNNVLSVTFTPNNTFDYNMVTSTVTQVVTPALLNVTAANTSRAFGQPNPIFQGAITGLQNGDNITASYSCSANNTSAVGAYPIVPSLNDPSNLETNYNVSLANGTLTVTQAAPIITWANPAPITNGTALGPSQLDATANVPGNFAYNPAGGTVLNVGTNQLSTIFTPTDTNDYLSATDTVSLVVTSPPVEVTGEPLLPPWGIGGLLLGLLASSMKHLARRTTSIPQHDNERENES
jgi:subtilase family serine protease